MKLLIIAALLSIATLSPAAEFGELVTDLDYVLTDIIEAVDTEEAIDIAYGEFECGLLILDAIAANTLKEKQLWNTK